MNKREPLFNGKPFSYHEHYYKELERLEQEGRIKIISSTDSKFKQMEIDTSYEGKKIKGVRGRKGYRKGNRVFIGVDVCDIYKIDDVNFENKVGICNLDNFIDYKLYDYTWNWNDKPGDYVYAPSPTGKGNVSMHRLIFTERLGTKAIEGMEIDHMNHDRKDNKLRNLRVVTGEENKANNEVMYCIKFNHDTELYECIYSGYLHSDKQCFNTFGVEFEVDEPVPIADFKEQFNKINNFINEHERAARELENSPLFIRFRSGDFDKEGELERILEMNFQKSLGQATDD